MIPYFLFYTVLVVTNFEFSCSSKLESTILWSKCFADRFFVANLDEAENSVGCPSPSKLLA